MDGELIEINLVDFILIKQKISELLDLDQKSEEYKKTKDIINSNFNIFNIFLIQTDGNPQMYIFTVSNYTKILDIKKVIDTHTKIPIDNQILTVSNNYKDYSDLIELYKKKDVSSYMGSDRVIYFPNDKKLNDNDKSLEHYDIKNENKPLNEGRTLKLKLWIK
jgi:hypothetical protein